MRLKKCLTSLLAVLISTVAFCCGPYWYYPHEYYMYKVIDDGLDVNEDAAIANCRQWQELTSSDIPLEDIREVVYDYPLDKLGNLLKRKNRRSTNAFVKWIAQHKDEDIMCLLHLARRSEIAREKTLSKWYYPYDGDEVSAELSNISLELGFAMQRQERLYDRYALQKARVMFSLGRYEDIITWWEIWEPSLREGMIKDMILGYLAGSYYRTGKTEKAIEYYSRIGDYESIAYCLGMKNSVSETESYLEFLAEYCPDGKKLPCILQEIFSDLEDRTFSWEFSEADYKARKSFPRLGEKDEEVYVKDMP
ncbi:MAG: hypothetical protein MJZ16_00485 [Bacteroidales bacterium]|nr:hypothetical protein [Bacteroidales bacterium]